MPDATNCNCRASSRNGSQLAIQAMFTTGKCSADTSCAGFTVALVGRFGILGMPSLGEPSDQCCTMILRKSLTCRTPAEAERNP